VRKQDCNKHGDNNNNTVHNKNKDVTGV